MIETHDELNFSLPQHCYEYCNTLGWFWDNFDHPQRLKLLYLAAAYLNQAAWHQKLTGDLRRRAIEKPANAGGLGAEQHGRRASRPRCIALDAPQGGGLDAGLSRQRPRHGAAGAARSRMACSRLGNDPHNQEIALCMLEDFGKNRSPDRGRLLLAAAQHTARHRKYGDPLDCSRRFGKALGVPELACAALTARERGGTCSPRCSRAHRPKAEGAMPTYVDQP